MFVPPAPATRNLFWGALQLLLISGCGGSATFAPPPQAPISASSATKPPPVISEFNHDDLELNLPLVNQNPGYVGAKVCGECHKSRLEEFSKTRHYVACCIPDPSRPLPEFDGTRVSFPARLPRTEFELTHRGQRSVQRFIQSKGTGEKQEGELPVSMIYGAGGTADEVYFSWQGNKLRELPLAWMHPQQQWGAQQFINYHDPANFGRASTTRCLECHNTWFEHVAGTENQYRPDSFLMGVTCERCHGPGQEHVVHHRANPCETAGKFVTHPGQLSREQLMDVCGQCHSSVVFRKDPVFSFRPGDSLAEHFRPFENRHFEDDHVADQVKYLRQSKCYQNSETLTCVSCHSPHHPTTPVASGVDSCRKCHQPADCGERESLPITVRDQCSACHMPSYNRVAIKFHTQDDQYLFPVRPTWHRIGIYPAARDETLLAWHKTQTDSASRTTAQELSTSLASHWAREAARYNAEHRFVAAIGALRDSLRFATSSETKQKLQATIDTMSSIDRDYLRSLQLMQTKEFPRAADLLQDLLKRQPNFAKAHGRLGTVFAQLGKMDLAEKHLKLVAEHDPDDASGYNMLGWLGYLRGDYLAAIEYFRQADEIYPFTAEINFRWSLALFKLMRWTEAESHLREVLKVDPNHASGCQALSHTLREQGRFNDALPYAYRAAQLTEFKQPDILLTLTDAFIVAERKSEAAAIATQAMELPTTRNSQFETEFQQRLDRLTPP